MSREEVCPSCGGTGSHYYEAEEPCPTCHGDRVIDPDKPKPKPDPVEQKRRSRAALKAALRAFDREYARRRTA